MIRLNNFSLLDILPNSMTQHHEDKAMAMAVTAIFKKVFSYCDILDPDAEIPENMLDLIAWENHVDFYDTSLTAEQKRDLIRKSDFFHKKKGTPAAVEELISIIFGEGKVSEWFQYDGEPYHFKVITNNRAVTNELAHQFILAVDSVKNKRSILDKVEISMVEDMNIYYSGVIHTGDHLLIKQVI